MHFEADDWKFGEIQRNTTSINDKFINVTVLIRAYKSYYYYIIIMQTMIQYRIVCSF